MLHSESLSKPLVRTNVYLSESQREALFTLAKEQDISAAELLRRFLEKDLRRAMKKRAGLK
jgi:hypothetical protein